MQQRTTEQGERILPRELEGFRDQLESIISTYPDRECLGVRQVAKYCGCTEKTAAGRFPFIGKGRGRYITRTSLARVLVNAHGK